MYCLYVKKRLAADPYPTRWRRTAAERRSTLQILETDRLILRQLTLDDTDDLAEVLSDPQAMRYYPASFTREQTIGWIEWNLRNYM